MAALPKGASPHAGTAHSARSAPFSGGHSVVDPPDSIPNSAVKRNCADGSVALAHARVGHRQDSTANPRSLSAAGFFLFVLPLRGTSKNPNYLVGASLLATGLDAWPDLQAGRLQAGSYRGSAWRA